MVKFSALFGEQKPVTPAHGLTHHDKRTSLRFSTELPTAHSRSFPGHSHSHISVFGDSDAITRRKSAYMRRKRKSTKSLHSSSDDVDLDLISQREHSDLKEIAEMSRVSDMTENIPEKPKKKILCIEIVESDEYSESDPEEICDGNQMGEEIIQDFLETAFGICSERFFNANAPLSITLELRNTWLRIMEAELLDEYKPEIGHLSANVFLSDIPPAPLSFDTWSRGTLEVLDLDQQGGKSKSSTLIPSKAVSQPIVDLKLPPPLDASYPGNSNISESGGEGDFYRRVDPSFTFLFKGGPQLVSATKLSPEDGFNIPLGNYSPVISDVPMPHKELIKQFETIGEEELDSFVTLVAQKQRSTDKNKTRKRETKTENGMAAQAVMPEDIATSEAIQARHITSQIKIKNNETVVHQRDRMKERLRMSNVTERGKK